MPFDLENNKSDRNFIESSSYNHPNAILDLSKVVKISAGSTRDKYKISFVLDLNNSTESIDWYYTLSERNRFDSDYKVIVELLGVNSLMFCNTVGSFSTLNKMESSESFDLGGGQDFDSPMGSDDITQL